jgi:hypothetical protein
MFNSSYQQISFRKQIISTTQSYPCPQCSSGMLEPFGLTETMKCTCCERTYVALSGGRLLYPANRLVMKISPTYWWDGLRWHWAGHTANTKQLLAIFVFFMTPILLSQVLFALNLLPEHPDWLNAKTAFIAVAALTSAAIYCFCADYDFVVKRRRAEKRPALPDRPTSNN